MIPSNHTEELREVFNIEKNGVDHYTPNNIGIEFKESYADKYPTFLIKLKEVLRSDIVVLCYKNIEFFVFESSDLLGHFGFDYGLAHPTIKFAKKYCNWYFKSYDRLKEFLYNY